MVGLVCMAFAVLFGMLGENAEALYLLSGMLFLLAVGLFLSHLKIWGKFRLPKLEKLFPKGNGKWDDMSGKFQ
jgi:hypothetical protein